MPGQSQPQPRPRLPVEDFHVRTLLPMAIWVKDRWGPTELARITGDIGLAPNQLEDRQRWVSHAQVETFLHGVRSLAGTDDVFQTACAYGVTVGQAPGRFLLWSSTPSRMVKLMQRSMPRQSQVSRYEVEDHGVGMLSLRYTTQVDESRLMCLARQAQLRAAPTLWGLPPAMLEETSCVAHGDEACTYHLRLYEHERRLPTLLGLAGGAAAAFGLGLLGVNGLAAWWAMPLTGAAVGYLAEYRHKEQTNLGIAQQVQQSIAELARDATEARRQMDALYRRQRDWTRVIEERLVASPIEGRVDLRPERVPLAPLARELQSRAQALLFDRDIRAMVVANRRLPDDFETDRRVFDRIIDDLLVNAARHTRRGRIAIHLKSSPIFLTLRITDNSRGMTRPRIQRLFDANAGLAMVVHLLAQIGGKLDVASMPQVGATFWVHLPLDLLHRPPASILERGHAELVRHVVTIRSMRP